VLNYNEVFNSIEEASRKCVKIFKYPSSKMVKFVATSFHIMNYYFFGFYSVPLVVNKLKPSKEVLESGIAFCRLYPRDFYL